MVLNRKIPETVKKELDRLSFRELRPSQEKAIDKGLFEEQNLLVCTPTASGKTLIAEMAFLNILMNEVSDSETETKPICIYIVPLKALASEKFKEFQERYPSINFALTNGDMDSDDRYLAAFDVIITTSEKMDSLIRHGSPWLSRVKLLIIDEIHLLNDLKRGPVLEILITAFRSLNKIQLIGLSATIGNPHELAEWLDAKLVIDNWRPVRLDKLVYLEGKLES